jgi:hypothetical protein
MTLFYSSQPESLPLELPPGTRYNGVLTNGCLPGGARLVDGRYIGLIRRDDGTSDAGSVSPQQILWRKVPVVGGEAKEEPWKVGEELEGRSRVGGAHRGRFAGFDIEGYAILECANGLSYEVDGKRVNGFYVTRESLRRLSAPTPSVPSLADGSFGPVICADCGEEITNPLEACARIQVVNGVNVYLPGTFHAKCPESAPTPSVPEPVATPTPKVDLCACGQSARGSLDFDGSPICSDCSAMVADLAGAAGTAELRGKALAKAHRELRRIEHTNADLDRPLLKLGGRFGKRVPVTHPAAWPSVGDDEP